MLPFRNLLPIGTNGSVVHRADVAGTVSGHGVTGTIDGLVYMWDMSTGSKLGSLHDFKGKH